MATSHFSGPIAISSGNGLQITDNSVSSYGWRDITSDTLVRGIGANDPDWAQVGTGIFYAYKFAINDEAWFTYHVPHDIVPSSDIHFHAHWIADGTNTAVVKWTFAYAYAKGFNQEAFDPDGTAITAQEAASGTAFQHMVTETTGVTIPTLTEPDGLILLKVTRTTNGGTDNTNGIFLLTADVHYQSTNMPTVNKAPGFYG